MRECSTRLEPDMCSCFVVMRRLLAPLRIGKWGRRKGVAKGDGRKVSVHRKELVLLANQDVGRILSTDCPCLTLQKQPATLVVPFFLR